MADSLYCQKKSERGTLFIDETAFRQGVLDHPVYSDDALFVDKLLYHLKGLNDLVKCLFSR